SGLRNKVIEGEEKNTLIKEAKDGQDIKAVLYDENHEAAAESEPVKITIDDHTGDICEGYFENGQVEVRNISDWAGEWQSVYPYLESGVLEDRKSTRLNSSHVSISYAVFCLKKKRIEKNDNVQVFISE